MQKDIFCPGTEFRLKIVRTIFLEKFPKLRDLEAISECFMHEYSEIGIILNLIFSISKQILTKCLKIFDFLKMSGSPSKNIRELGSQVPDFLYVC